ncbi:hypothetical protein Igni_1342 [Ignicoccus hospitalis KIN4/I]|uniref:DNA binding protein Tfx C-terminal domain-containing protein n=2 Tax=Ignicoccus TaxID=54258 RepID=A8AC66_IGNH4|nr:hypothetical protein Igni_1342 [Ignicoccus hospitalis KIN4/I]
MLRSKGYGVTEIAKMLNTSKQNVTSLIKRGMKNVKKYEVTYKLLKASGAKRVVFFDEGVKLYDVASQLIKIADSLSIKLKGNINDIMSYLKFEGDVINGALAKPHAVGVLEDGHLVVLKDEALEEFGKLVTLYETVVNKGDLSER